MGVGQEGRGGEGEERGKGRVGELLPWDLLIVFFFRKLKLRWETASPNDGTFF